MEQSVEPNSFEKFEAIVPLSILRPYFRFFYLLFFSFEKRFDRKSSKSGHENLAQITSTFQVEPSTLNFNFDDIGTNFLQALIYYGFSRLLCYNVARQN